MLLICPGIDTFAASILLVCPDRTLTNILFTTCVYDYLHSIALCNVLNLDGLLRRKLCIELRASIAVPSTTSMTTRPARPKKQNIFEKTSFFPKMKVNFS
ncbi:unnamed protein product, partial [Meganyctiphanes norvegica]